MKGLQMNIQFDYLYRDCGNFKNFGNVVFANKRNLSAKEIHEKLFGTAKREPFFRASDLGLPDLYFKDFPYDPELDHELHEYYGVSETKEPTNDAANRDISDVFLAIAMK